MKAFAVSVGEISMSFTKSNTVILFVKNFLNIDCCVTLYLYLAHPPDKVEAESKVSMTF